MKRSFIAITLAAASIVSASPAFSQDDESRQQSGLPTFIGVRPGSNTLPGTDAVLSGSLTLQGNSDQMTEPTFTVTVLANGAIVARQRVTNRGGFSFNNVPRTAVSLLVEADGLEIANYQLGTLNPPPLTNRQDLILSWSLIGQARQRKAEVLSVRNAYSRSSDNQKAFENALELQKSKKADAALKEFNKIVAIDPNDFVVWTEIGSAYFRADRFSDAETSYNKALALKPDFAPALLNLGKLYLNQKKLDQSIDVLSQALTASPDSADVNQYLGEAYLQAKKGSKAVPLLYKAIELAPIDKADIHLRLATLYNGANLKDRAVVEYKAFLQKMPNYKDKAGLEKYIKDNQPK